MEYQGKRLRHEYKYYINTAVYVTLRERFKQFLRPDENMVKEDGYWISSLYFDDLYHSALEEKISGTRFRKKYRIRIYEHSDALIKLECKMKYDTYIAKDSFRLTRKEYDEILGGDYEFLLEKDADVCRQMYAALRTRLLEPVVVVEYLREAYVLPEGNVRLTFDKHIAASIHGQDMFSDGCVVSEVLPPGILVLEVKYDDYIPCHVLRLLQSSMTQKCAVSKYVMCVSKNRRVEMI